MTNPADNGWRTRVQALEPTEKREGWGAFSSASSKAGGGWGAFNSQETTDKRAQEQVSRANREREETAASIEAIKEKRKYEEAINLGSQKAYPSLGPAPVQKPKTALNFKAVAEAAASAAEVKEEEWSEFESAPAPPPKTIVSNFLDTFEDDDEDEEEGEFNADIISMRRRGDKGIW